MSTKIKTTGLLAVSIFALSPLTAAAGDGYVPPLPTAIPSNPNPGECYARVEIPARYDTQMQQVLIQDGYTEYNVQQPSITSRAQEVMIKEPSVEYRVRQPRYSTVTEQMMVRPSYEKLQVSPPEFKNITETRQVTGPRLVWKKGNPAELKAQGYVIHSTANGGPGGQGFHSTTQYGATQADPQLCGATCEIWCLVEEPGQTVSYSRRVMTKPSTVHRIPVEARYQSITKQVVVDPGGVEEIPVPAQYQTVTVEDVLPARATPAREVPPQYEGVGVKVPVENSRYEWRRVICDTGQPLEPMAQAPDNVPQVNHGPTYGGYSSGYVVPPVTHHAPTVTHHAPMTTHQAPVYHDNRIHQYEGVVCDERKKKGECYGQDVIEAYERSQHQSGAYQQHGGSYGYPQQGYSQGYQSHSQSGSYSSGTVYDKATGYYEDAKRAHDLYETVDDRRKRRRR